MASKSARGNVTRVEKQAIKKPVEAPSKPQLKMDLQFFASDSKATAETKLLTNFIETADHHIILRAKGTGKSCTTLDNGTLVN